MLVMVNAGQGKKGNAMKMGETPTATERCRLMWGSRKSQGFSPTSRVCHHVEKEHIKITLRDTFHVITQKSPVNGMEQKTVGSLVVTHDKQNYILKSVIFRNTRNHRI